MEDLRPLARTFARDALFFAAGTGVTLIFCGCWIAGYVFADAPPTATCSPPQGLEVSLTASLSLPLAGGVATFVCGLAWARWRLDGHVAWEPEPFP